MSVRPVTLDLKDGRPRLLKLEVDGILLFEEKFERPIVDIATMIPTMRMTLLLLWSSLLWKEPALTLDDVKALYNSYHDQTGENFLDLMPTLAEAVARALIRQPQANGHDEAAEPKNARTEAPDTAASPTGSGT